MLSIIFLILKILGILLLILLLLILFFAVVVLFVPVRYRLTASRYEKLKGELLISWLLRGISLRVFYDGRALARGKVLWFRLFEKQLWPFEEEETGGEFGEATEPTEIGRPKAEAREREEKWPEAERPESEQPEAGEMDAGQPESERTEEPDGLGKKKAEHPPLPQEEEGKEEEFEERLRATELSPSEGREKEEPDPALSGPSNPGIRLLLGRLKETVKRFTRKLIGKISGFFRDFHQSLKRIPKIWTEIKNKLADGRKSFERMREILTNEENREVFRLLVSRGRKLFRHVRPKKIKGKLQFGFSDPYRTGQVLTAVSPFYGLYAKELELIPDFEHEVLKGEISVKGRIRMGVVLWTGIRLFLNKNFRRLLRRFR